MNDIQIKTKILNAIADAQAKGYTLISENWGNELSKCACALGCVNMMIGSTLDDGNADHDVAKSLEVDYHWVSSFIDGFDDNGSAKYAANESAWKMGKEIRTETKPIDYDTFVNQMDE